MASTSLRGKHLYEVFTYAILNVLVRSPDHSLLYSKDQRSLVVCQVINLTPCRENKIYHITIISYHLFLQVLLHNTREVKKKEFNIIVVPTVDHILPRYILRF